MEIRFLNTIKLTFEADLQFQQDAIKSITDLFEGQQMEDAVFEFKLEEAGQLNLINVVESQEFDNFGL